MYAFFCENNSRFSLDYDVAGLSAKETLLKFYDGHTGRTRANVFFMFIKLEDDRFCYLDHL